MHINIIYLFNPFTFVVPSPMTSFHRIDYGIRHSSIARPSGVDVCCHRLERANIVTSYGLSVGGCAVKLGPSYYGGFFLLLGLRAFYFSSRVWRHVKLVNTCTVCTYEQCPLKKPAPVPLLFSCIFGRAEETYNP